MTLDEAIQHCEEKALCGDICGLEHKQLAEWLKELKGYRMDEETKLDKTTVTGVLEKLSNTAKDDTEKIRNTDDTDDFSVEYSGIDDGQRFPVKSSSRRKKTRKTKWTVLWTMKRTTRFLFTWAVIPLNPL